MPISNSTTEVVAVENNSSEQLSEIQQLLEKQLEIQEAEKVKQEVEQKELQKEELEEQKHLKLEEEKLLEEQKVLDQQAEQEKIDSEQQQKSDLMFQTKMVAQMEKLNSNNFENIEVVQKLDEVLTELKTPTAVDSVSTYYGLMIVPAVIILVLFYKFIMSFIKPFW